MAPWPVTTRGTEQASVEGESVTNDPTTAAVLGEQLPSTGSNGASSILVLGGGLVLAGGLLLAARRRMPVTADLD